MARPEAPLKLSAFHILNSIELFKTMWNAVKVVAKDIEGKFTLSLSDLHNAFCAKTTPVGFEPTRGDTIGLAGRRLSRSAKVSSDELSGASIVDVAVLRRDRSPSPMAANCR